MKNFKFSAILFILYLGFISIGIPDQILGVSWTSMRFDFSKQIEAAGIIVSTITVFTILSSFLSPFFIKKFKTNTILIFSTFLITLSLTGFAIAPNWQTLLAFCIPMGLGAGTVDASLNNYASKNFDAKNLNWLHASWGIGATIGPMVMTFALTLNSWRFGYILIACILFLFFLTFIFTKKLWQEEKNETVEINKPKTINFRKVFKLKPILSMLFFFLYAALEVGVGLWGATVLIESRNFSPLLSGSLITAYWASLTVGRFLTGIIATKFKTDNIITAGLIFGLFGMVLFLTHNFILNAIALMIFGLGISGLFPCMMSVGSKRFEDDVFDLMNKIKHSELEVKKLLELKKVLINEVFINNLNVENIEL
jgi:fucose permease